MLLAYYLTRGANFRIRLDEAQLRVTVVALCLGRHAKAPQSQGETAASNIAESGQVDRA